MLRIITAHPKAGALRESLALACHLADPVLDGLDLALARREATQLPTADHQLQRLAEWVLP